MLPLDFEKALIEGPGCFSISTYERPAVKFLDSSETLGSRRVIEAAREATAEAEIDACKRFITPLMASATHARLYPSKVFKRYFGASVGFLIPRAGYLEFDLRKECVIGNEEFWRAGASDGEYRRGTIVVVQPSSVALEELLKGCVLYGVMASRYQILKGSSAAAVRFAEEHPRTSERVFLFSASNGMQHVEIYPPRGAVYDDCTTALDHAIHICG